MKTGLSSARFLFLTAGIFLLFACIFVFTGCRKIEESYREGVERGKRERAESAAANNNSQTQTAPSPTPAPSPLTITTEDLKDNKIVALNTRQWKYQPGDDANWANQSFDDSNWEAVNPAFMTGLAPPKSGWKGIGWFRLKVNIDDSLAGQSFSLAMRQTGASEIYVNGKLVKSFGRVSANPVEEQTFNPNFIPVGFFFTNAGEQTIAVRYSNTQAEKNPFEVLGFDSRLSLLNPTIGSALEETDFSNSLKGGIFGISLALGLLHLLLFVLYPRQKGNLFYALFLLSEASNDLIMETFFSNKGTGLFFILMLIGSLAGSVNFVSFTAYLYTMLENRIPRYVKIIAAIWAAVILLFFVAYLTIHPILTLASLLIGLLLFLALMISHTVIVLIVIVRAVIRGIENSWVLGLVGASFVISNVALTVLASTFGENSSYLHLGEFACLTLLVVANAAFLARQFARTNADLEVQLLKEVEHEKEKSRLAVIEAENERRAKELEEARQLQLSMLPKSVPKLSNFDIAAYMKPATEVGGDYYDFYVGSEGTLTVAVGDATGHGLKAGSVVTATKSLFNAYSGETDITDIFKKSNLALKRMNLRGLYMAMAMIKIKDNTMTVSIAGMPPLLIYKAATEQVEEISIRALPLGSIANFSYQEQKVELSRGDTVVLMSDGFPEMFNERGEMLGYDQAKMILNKNAGKSAQEITNRFVETAQEWAGTRPSDDDVTFVIIKMI